MAVQHDVVSTVGITTMRCSRCALDKPLSDFALHPRGRNGVRNPCKSCTAAAWRAKYRDNPEFRAQHKLKARENSLRSRYGVDLATVEAAICAICGASKSKAKSGRLHVDHDHATGEVRGFLCLSCNVGLGHLRDDPELLRKAADYIEGRR